MFITIINFLLCGICALRHFQQERDSLYKLAKVTNNYNDWENHKNKFNKNSNSKAMRKILKN